MESRSPCWCPGVLVTAAMLAGAPAAAQSRLADLASLSLEELSNIEITSVSRRAERLSDAPTSVFVISADDIRRSGATSLPEVLRLAPNLQVARNYADGYAISSRGFNSNSANKLLVLIDGRSVYTPFFAGVFWDVQGVLLEDVERIEVISGPGGTLWGVNAVNGVINVITRPSQQTRGQWVSAGAGNREAQLAARHGAALGDGDFRVYAQSTYRRRTQTASGADVDDASHFTQAGFRADWAANADKVTFQGDIYRGERGQPEPGMIFTGLPLDLGHVTTSGGNLNARWERRLEGGSTISAQAYYDRTQRTVPPTFAETLDIVDLQVQHSLQPAAAHTVVWGGEYRYGRDRLTNSATVSFLPANVNQTWASLFAQDEIALREDLRLTLGARIERNDYTGNEWLPNARLAWKPAADHLLWGAVSRTVRAPSRLDRDIFVPMPGQSRFLLIGGPDFQSEIAKVYELGYRGQPTPGSSFSATVFHADYDRLKTQEVVRNPLTVFYENRMQATVRGLEMWGSVQAMPQWRLHAGFTRLLQRFELKPGSVNATAPAAAAGANPGRQVLLRSSLDLPRQMGLDLSVRYVSALSAPAVPSYTAVDLRYAWRLARDLELSVTAQNVTDPGHEEFTRGASSNSEFGRGIFAQFTGRF